MSENGKGKDNEFDNSDLDITPVERPMPTVNRDEAQAELDHYAVVELGKRVTMLEARMDERFDRLETLVRELLRR